MSMTRHTTLDTIRFFPTRWPFAKLTVLWPDRQCYSLDQSSFRKLLILDLLSVIFCDPQFMGFNVFQEHPAEGNSSLLSHPSQDSCRLWLTNHSALLLLALKGNPSLAFSRVLSLLIVISPSWLKYLMLFNKRNGNRWPKSEKVEPSEVASRAFLDQPKKTNNRLQKLMLFG